MGCCFHTGFTKQQLILGPDAFEECPLAWKSNDKIWETDLTKLTNNIMQNAIIQDRNLILFIFSFVKSDIRQSIGYPRQFMIDLAFSNPSLQPLDIPILSEHSKQEFQCIQDEQRKSYSIFDDAVINSLIDSWSDVFSMIRPTVYVKDHHFHEIVVYEEGGYFQKHVDTMIEFGNKLYNYTLILIPPNNYKGGELIIYNKGKNIVEVMCDNYNWKWVIFHKQLEHECKPIIEGYKIIIKFHITLMTEWEIEVVENLGDLEIDDVAFNPMALGVPT